MEVIECKKRPHREEKGREKLGGRRGGGEASRDRHPYGWLTELAAFVE